MLKSNTECHSIIIVKYHNLCAGKLDKEMSLSIQVCIYHNTFLQLSYEKAAHTKQNIYQTNNESIEVIQGEGIGRKGEAICAPFLLFWN